MKRIAYQIQGLLGPVTHPRPSNHGDSLRRGDVATGAVDEIGNRHPGEAELQVILEKERQGSLLETKQD
jgi:hypothetical protein